MSIRVAVIGAGIMGADHARIISEELPGATLQVVCDLSEAMAVQVAETCAGEHASTDTLATIRRGDVDAVVIASPDSTHAELTLAAIEAGKPVLCEKPLALTSSDCLEIIKAECAVGRQLVQVGFMRRFDPSYVEMKACLLSGKIGFPVMMHNFHRNVEAPNGFDGGLMAVTNSAPHEFDVVRFVLDTEISTVTAFEPNAISGDLCKPVVLVLETSGGQLVTIEVNNNAAYGYDVRGELVGSEGSLSLGGISANRLDRELISATSYAADWRPRFREAYRLQDKAWVNSIINRIPSTQAATAWDGYCAAIVAEAGASALKSSVKTTIELAERPGLYAEVGAAA